MHVLSCVVLNALFLVFYSVYIRRPLRPVRIESPLLHPLPTTATVFVPAAITGPVHLLYGLPSSMSVTAPQPALPFLGLVRKWALPTRFYEATSRCYHQILTSDWHNSINSQHNAIVTLVGPLQKRNTKSGDQPARVREPTATTIPTVRGHLFGKTWATSSALWFFYRPLHSWGFTVSVLHRQRSRNLLRLDSTTLDCR